MTCEGLFSAANSVFHVVKLGGLREISFVGMFIPVLFPITSLKVKKKKKPKNLLMSRLVMVNVGNALLIPVTRDVQTLLTCLKNMEVCAGVPGDSWGFINTSCCSCS